MTTDTTTVTATDDARRERLTRARYGAAVGTMIVTGAFCVVIATILALSFVQKPTVGLDKSEELTHLRGALLKVSDPDAREAVLEDLRRRDLVLRQEFFGGRTFRRTGGYLLLAGLAAFIISASRAAACRRRLPMPQPAGTASGAAVVARVARWAVAGTGLMLVAAGALVMILYGGGPDLAVPPEGDGGANGGGKAAPTDKAGPPTAEEIHKQWPRFRGPDGSGWSAYTNVPKTWNGKTGENILWKVPVPLAGENSPVVWGDRVFLSGATKDKREVYAFSAADGKILWQQPVSTPAGSAGDPPELLDATGYAAPTAATDGRYVCAIFANGDVACFDVEGKPQWARNLGRFKNSYGYSSSLNLYGDTLLVLNDQGSPGKPDSRLMALDLATGETVWETSRPVPASWATPILARTDAREEFIANAKPWVIAYNPADGKELWRAKVLDGDVAPSPVYHAGMVFTVQAGSQLTALRTGGEGDVSKTAVAWIGEDGLPDIVSPITDGKVVLLVTTDGLLTCYAVADGKMLWEQEMDATILSSPSLVGQTFYLMDEKGVMRLFTTEGGYKDVGKAELGEPASASPAFLDGRIYIRGKTNLYAIGAKQAAPGS